MSSSTTTPELDVVAVSYEAIVETQSFLRSFNCVDVSFSLTLIDNNSPDPRVVGILEESIAPIRDMTNCMSASLVLNSDNVGYARACNTGASLGNAPVIALMNCDVQWIPGAARQILACFKQYPRIGVLGPRTTTSSGEITHAGIVKKDNGSDAHRWWMSRDDSLGRDFIHVPTVSGATYFVRRSMWESLTECEEFRSVAPDAEGAFLPTRHYFEETYCSYHAREHGWDVAYNGHINMIHEWHKSSPVGGVGEQVWKQSEDYFLAACRDHGIDPNAPVEQGQYTMRD